MSLTPLDHVIQADTFEIRIGLLTTGFVRLMGEMSCVIVSQQTLRPALSHIDNTLASSVFSVRVVDRRSTEYC